MQSYDFSMTSDIPVVILFIEETYALVSHRGPQERFCPKSVELHEHTFQRTETTIENQLQITKLPLREDNGRQLLSFSLQLVVTGRVTSQQVLEDPSMWFVRHCVLFLQANLQIRDCNNPAQNERKGTRRKREKR